MKGSADRITTCTTTQFDGVISVIDPDNSWVARWQRTGPFDSLFLLFLYSKCSFSEICPWNVCRSRYWTRTRRCWTRTRTKKYQISPTRSNWPGLRAHNAQVKTDTLHLSNELAMEPLYIIRHRNLTLQTSIRGTSSDVVYCM
jgi:hypothetical protein